MRLATLVLFFFALPSFAQPLPVDVSTGAGSATRERIVSGPGSWAGIGYGVNPNGATWFLTAIDEHGGMIDVTTPSGVVTIKAPSGGARAMTRPLASAPFAGGVLWTGFSGPATVDYDTTPKVGDPYLGRLADFPAGSTAKWSKILGATGTVPRWSLYATISGQQVVVISSY